MATRITGTSVGRPPLTAAKPVSGWAFTGRGRHGLRRVRTVGHHPARQQLGAKHHERHHAEEPDGYRSIPVIGPLFLIQGAGSIVLAVLLALFRRLGLMAAGTVVLASTAAVLVVAAAVVLAAADKKGSPKQSF